MAQWPWEVVCVCEKTYGAVIGEKRAARRSKVFASYGAVIGEKRAARRSKVVASYGAVTPGQAAKSENPSEEKTHTPTVITKSLPLTHERRDNDDVGLCVFRRRVINVLVVLSGGRLC